MVVKQGKVAKRIHQEPPERRGGILGLWRAWATGMRQTTRVSPKDSCFGTSAPLYPLLDGARILRKQRPPLQPRVVRVGLKQRIRPKNTERSLVPRITYSCFYRNRTPFVQSSHLVKILHLPRVGGLQSRVPKLFLCCERKVRLRRLQN